MGTSTELGSPVPRMIVTSWPLDVVSSGATLVFIDALLDPVVLGPRHA